MATVGATATARDDLRELGERAAAQLHHLVRVRVRVRVRVGVRVRVRLRPSSITSCHSGLGRPRHCLSATGRAHAAAAHSRSAHLGDMVRYGEIWGGMGR